MQAKHCPCLPYNNRSGSAVRAAEPAGACAYHLKRVALNHEAHERQQAIRVCYL